MIRRLKAYREANNSVIAEPSVQQFFKLRGIEKIHEENCNTTEDKVIAGFKIYIERVIIILTY